MEVVVIMMISTDTCEKKKIDKNNPEMGTNSVARQMHQKTV